MPRLERDLGGPMRKGTPTVSLNFVKGGAPELDKVRESKNVVMAGLNLRWGNLSLH